jgi:NAD(P)-dependent dehydrogenase (short-subunit alcohol dehydrogenase family)
MQDQQTRPSAGALTEEVSVQLTGRTALVTGGAGGIGAAAAARLSFEGAFVVVADLNATAAAACAESLPGPALGVELDVTSTHAITALVAQVESDVGGIDLLVNNAGLYDLEPLLAVTPAGFDRLFSVNTRGLFFVMQAVARAMVAAGRPGAIVNVASQAGRRGEAASAIYAATKAAVISLTRSAALALIADDIRVNAVAPGVVDTPMWVVVDRLHAETTGAVPGETLRQAVEAIPVHRMGTPDEIATAIVFLLTDASRYIVGQTLNIDGGTILS